jgi:hypothetical protein
MNTQTQNFGSRFIAGLGRLSASTVAGLVLVPLGAWCALEPYVIGNWAWHWDVSRFFLALVPGSLAVLGGLLMLTGRRGLIHFGGGVALAAGAWFVLGPIVYSITSPAELGTAPGGPSVRLFQWMPFFFGAGAMISALGAYGMGLIAPLEFGDDAWAEPATTTATRARMPLPPEHPRRQRGVREPAERQAPSQTRRSAGRDG